MNFAPAYLPFKAINMLNEHIRDPKYKTEICKNWEKSGSCPYNNKCRFAHGKDELMNKEIEANPNYRARDCLNFFKNGVCNYGRRCCFKHDDRKINEENMAVDSLILLQIRNPLEKRRLSIFKEVITDTCFNRKKISLKSSSSTASTNSSRSNQSDNTRKRDSSIIAKNSLNSTSDEIIIEGIN